MRIGRQSKGGAQPDGNSWQSGGPGGHVRTPAQRAGNRMRIISSLVAVISNPNESTHQSGAGRAEGTRQAGQQGPVGTPAQRTKPASKKAARTITIWTVTEK